MNATKNLLLTALFSCAIGTHAQDPAPALKTHYFPTCGVAVETPHGGVNDYGRYLMLANGASRDAAIEASTGRGEAIAEPVESRAVTGSYARYLMLTDGVERERAITMARNVDKETALVVSNAGGDK